MASVGTLRCGCRCGGWRGFSGWRRGGCTGAATGGGSRLPGAPRAGGLDLQTRLRLHLGGTPRIRRIGARVGARVGVCSRIEIGCVDAWAVGAM